MSRTTLFFLMATVTLAAQAQTPDIGAGTMAAQVLATMPPKIGVSVAMDGMETAQVKGAPFCAVVTTEHTQLFADGNRIHTSDNSTLCRDSEGRTRRESELNLLGATSQRPATKLITIIDSVAGFRYVLDPNSKTARKMVLPSAGGGIVEKGARQNGGPAVKEKVMFFRQGPEPAADVAFGNVFINTEGGPGASKGAQSEDLGDQTIEGIHATGRRMTTTIPAGKMGNEQPIVVTSERWYSPELKATIMTKHNDPWAGEMKMQFSSVNTAEPDSSLFVVPSDYKVVDEKADRFLIKLPPPAPAAE
ncbi:MAG TPA: hypothetical protein VJ731_12585 [Terriglobales bacterium]|nr:hypothetical protein [Terriglobales bacterium]